MIELLAKSSHGDRRVSLLQHSLDVERAAQLIFALDGRWGRRFCDFFRLTTEDRDRFLLNLRVACLLHDLGKANADFQAAVLKVPAPIQALRHEHLSALVLHLPDVRRWLAANSMLDLDVITGAILSHHLKASDEGEYRWATSLKESVQLQFDHPQAVAILARVADIANLQAPPILPTGIWQPKPPWETAWKEGMRNAASLRRSLRKDTQKRSLLLAVKAALIAADGVASGLIREQQDVAFWIDDVVHREPLALGDIGKHVISPRVEQIKAKHTQFEFHRFQLLAADQGPRALLLAACGAGKTLAAWKWSERQRESHAFGRVIFLYPTRGTATEGFRDYVAWAPEAEAALVHGTAQYELESMTENPPDAMKGKHFELNETDARLFAFGLWSRRYFSATVDQFLGFMEHSYTGLCLLPILADAAIVIDEVHSFDRHMFEVLVNFLRAFDVPVLCMTATLSSSRREDLELCGLKVYPRDEHRDQLRDLEELEQRPRYAIEQLEGKSSEDDAMSVALKAYRDGLQVLWVVNRVAWCQSIAVRLRQEFGSDVGCYHSRFRLRDRKRVHAETIAKFQQKKLPAIAVTTQVCEMSLDLDADVLITQLAPPSSLVQRMGRSNRHLARGFDFRSRVIVYAPSSELPYSGDEMKAARAFMTDLGSSEISQRRLADALEKHAPGEPMVSDAGAFLTGGYFALAGSLRDTDEASKPCILDGDLEVVTESLRRKIPIDEWIVSVPRRAVLPDAPTKLPRYLSLASSAQYDESLGFIVSQGGC